MSSPYPTLKGFGVSRMPALTQYAQAEAVLKCARLTSDNFEANIASILKSRQDANMYKFVDESGEDMYVFIA